MRAIRSYATASIALFLLSVVAIFAVGASTTPATSMAPSTTSAPATQAARVTYKAEKDLATRLPWRRVPALTGVQADGGQDPDDGWTWLGFGDNTLRYRGKAYPFSGYSGPGQWPSVSKLGFFDGYAVFEAVPGFVPPIAPEGRETPRFMLTRGTGERVFLSPGVDPKSGTVEGAVLIWTRGGDPKQDRWSAVYEVSVRGFEGVKRRLRVRTYGPDGTVRKTLEGPEFGFDLKLQLGEQPTIAFVDLRARALVLVTGEVWDIESGRTIGRITGVDHPLYLRTTGEFYTLALGRTARQWGLADATTGDVVAGGEDGRELTIGRVVIDTLWRARAVPLVSVVIPAPGDVDPRVAEDDWSKRGPTDPFLLRRTFTYRVPKQDLDMRTGKVIRTQEERYRLESIYRIMPGRSGLVDIQGYAWVPSHGVLLGLAIVADPERPASPVALGYGLGYGIFPPNENSLDRISREWTQSRGQGGQADIATAPATPDGASLAVWSRLNGASFLYDRKTGSIYRLPEQPWAEGAGPADASSLGAAPGQSSRAGDLFGASVEVVRLGPPVSDARCEYEAFFEPDGRALIFSRSEWPSQRELGFFRSERAATGWGNPTPYQVPKGAKSPVFTGDGQSLYFHMLVQDAAGKTSADLFVARRAGGRWGAPENLGSAVNSSDVDLEPTLSADGGTLVFTSWRPGGQGSSDLYISTRDAKGAWTAPRNLGPAINTKGAEGGAHLSPDGRTLYFGASGDRPPLEIYTSTFDGTQWSPRRKLSPLVRDAAGDEFWLVPSPGGQEAIVLADKGRMTKDCSDVFLVRPAAMPSGRTWRYDYTNQYGRWTGDIVLKMVGGVWTGKMKSDQFGQWLELRNIRVTPAEMGFDLPSSAQTYRGRFLPGGKVAGTFTWSGQEWDWAAEEETTGR